MSSEFDDEKISILRFAIKKKIPTRLVIVLFNNNFDRKSEKDFETINNAILKYAGNSELNQTVDHINNISINSLNLNDIIYSWVNFTKNKENAFKQLNDFFVVLTEK